MVDEKVNNLKAGMESVNITVRVLEASDAKVIQTKNGTRTISEAIVGDDTGRVKLTLWGNLAGTIKEGMIVRIDNAWTTAYKGKVQLNAGSKSKISEVNDESFPQEDQIPDATPSAGEYRRPFRGTRRQGRGPRRPRYGEESGEEE